jgi:hypothetical protein
MMLSVDDLKYVIKVIEVMNSLDSEPNSYHSVEPINIYSDADPIGYVKYADSEYYFHPGDRYNGDD